MSLDPSSSRFSVKYKLIALIASTVLLTLLVFVLVINPLLNDLTSQSHNGWLIFIVFSATLLLLVAVIYGVSRTFIVRLEQVAEVTRAWLRGNLSIRIDDHTADELGLISDNLDQIASHLEEDEEDLSRLSQSNTRLTDQVRALAVVEERNRLARELHDSVKQHLFSLVMTASAIQTRFDTLTTIPKDVREMVDEIVSASQTAQRETTRLIEDLRPGSLEEQGLSAALNDYTLLFGAQEHLLIYLDVNCNDMDLPPAIVEGLYRVAQEALHNVARHAHATRVDVELRCASESVYLKIEDNGIGFDKTRAKRGLGITNMQERLLGLGGRLVIESQPSIGTTVEAEVQLKTQPSLVLQQKEPADSQANPSNWLWLGQKLVIPVGQPWPWLKDDEDRHLTEPLLEPDGTPLTIHKERRLLALRTRYTLRRNEQRRPICTILREKSGYTWDCNAASWDLRHIPGLFGRGVLLRNAQALAALQYQGRQMNTWTEIVYRTRTYILVYDRRNPNHYTLKDNHEHVFFYIDKNDMSVTIEDAVPLPLLLMAITRFLDEASVTQATG